MDEETVTMPHEPPEDEAHSTHTALARIFGGTSTSGVQRLVGVPSFPTERNGGEGDEDERAPHFQPEQSGGGGDFRPSHMALVWTFGGASTNGVQCLVEVPSFPPEDLAGGTESPTYYCFGSPDPEALGGCGQ